MRIPRPLSARTATRCAGIIVLAAALAGPAFAVEPRLHANGRSVESAAPPARVQVPESAEYLGNRRWVLYGYADCDLHVYAQRDAAGVVQRLYWVQSEAYIPSRPEMTHANDYARSRTVELDGLDFHLDTWTRNLADKAPADSDLAQVEQLVAARDLRLPEDMAFVRLVHLPDPAARKELMLIYAERIDGPNDAAPGNVVARARDAFRFDALSPR